MSVFINFTNHPSTQWEEAQIKEASTWGKIIDIPFPHVDATADEKVIGELAQRYVHSILEHNPTIVLCQGEFTLCYLVITKLIEHNIKVVAACSQRLVEEVFENGQKTKKSRFVFSGFREYGKD